ncbi:hypothetical protein LBMAG56_51110 [Verrucomicrobiota bacterium]|nr:hypothetical protein LBMAG56_51110 [Verrucomicrobiota bacterium]
MEVFTKFKRRLSPADPGPRCFGTYGCPEILELETGDFAVIGADITRHADKLPPDAGCAPDERMVRIPRHLLVRAKPMIPDAV